MMNDELRVAHGDDNYKIYFTKLFIISVCGGVG